VNGTIKIFLILTVVAYFANYNEKTMDDTVTSEICDALKLNLDKDYAEKGVWQAFAKKDNAFKKLYRMFRQKEYTHLDAKVKNKLSFCVAYYNGKHLKDISDHEEDITIQDYCAKTQVVGKIKVNGTDTDVTASVCGNVTFPVVSGFTEEDCSTLDGYNWLPLAAKKAVDDVLNLRGVEIPEAVQSQRPRYKACLALSNISIIDKIKRDLRNMLIKVVTQNRPEDLHEKMALIKSGEVEQTLLTVWVLVVIYLMFTTRNFMILGMNIAQYVVLVSLVNLHASFAYMILIATTLLGQYRIAFV